MGKIQIKEAVEKSYHDVLSDIDLTVTVRMSPCDMITPEQYMCRLDRYGITQENCLGIVQVRESRLYRIILKNGMRYDFGFDFVFDEKASALANVIAVEMEQGKDLELLPYEQENRFWFVQIQALAKLYRNDFLIADHLANMNINETLVQQMVLRDIKYGTRFHRYGYCEALEYLQNNKEKCPYQKENPIFSQIAEKLHAASVAYDRLAVKLNPQYEEQRQIFFAIWEETKVFQELRLFRLTRSREEKIKPYFIYNGSQLKDLIAKNPKNKEELLRISGFGEVKVNKYGDDILKISAFMQSISVNFMMKADD